MLVVGERPLPLTLKRPHGHVLRKMFWASVALVLAVASAAAALVLVVLEQPATWHIGVVGGVVFLLLLVSVVAYRSAFSQPDEMVFNPENGNVRVVWPTLLGRSRAQLLNLDAMEGEPALVQAETDDQFGLGGSMSETTVVFWFKGRSPISIELHQESASFVNQRFNNKTATFFTSDAVTGAGVGQELQFATPDVMIEQLCNIIRWHRKSAYPDSLVTIAASQISQGAPNTEEKVFAASAAPDGASMRKIAQGGGSLRMPRTLNPAVSHRRPPQQGFSPPPLEPKVELVPELPSRGSQRQAVNAPAAESDAPVS